MSTICSHKRPQQVHVRLPHWFHLTFRDGDDEKVVVEPAGFGIVDALYF